MCSCLYAPSRQQQSPSSYPPRPSVDVELGNSDVSTEMGELDYDQAIDEIDSNSGSPVIPANPFMSNLSV